MVIIADKPEKQKMTVTPWEVSGHMDYEKLIKDFGTAHITKPLLDRVEKIAGESHFMLTRKIFFSHRDLDWVLDKYERGEKFALYTGRKPSKGVHIGHLLPWMFSKWIPWKL